MIMFLYNPSNIAAIRCMKLLVFVEVNDFRPDTNAGAHKYFKYKKPVNTPLKISPDSHTKFFLFKNGIRPNNQNTEVTLMGISIKMSRANNNKEVFLFADRIRRKRNTKFTTDTKKKTVSGKNEN